MASGKASHRDRPALSRRARGIIVRDWIGYTAGRFRAELTAGVRSSREALRAGGPAGPGSPGPGSPGPGSPGPGRPGPGRPGGAAGSRRMRVRTWRRTRPFWGGLLLILAGLELILIPLSGILLHGAIKLVIYIGIGGVFGVLIGALLVACGLLLWLTPAHRTFYAIAGVLLAVLSFITSNLGGFFVGMLLGITGGSLAFGWTPDPAAAPSSPPDETAPPDQTASLDEVLGELGDESPLEQEPRAGRNRGRLASAAMPVILLSSLLGGHASLLHKAAQPRRAQGCILWIICSSSPSPSPSSPPDPGSSPAPVPAGSGAPASPGSGGGPGGGGGGTGGGGAGGGTGQPAKSATAQGGVAAALATSVITANSATLDGLAYQGTANVPVAGGTQKMMKFTLDSLTLSGNVTATVTEDGQTTVTQNSSLAFSSGVTLYATKLSGSLLGVPVTLTPGNVISILLHVLNTLTPLVPVTMTNVTTDQPLVFAGALQAASLSITV